MLQTLGYVLIYMVYVSKTTNHCERTYSTADYTLQPAWIGSCSIYYVSAFRNWIRVQQLVWVWVLRQGSMSLRPPTTVDELTQRLATLSNQLESALALSTTFPHSGIELEANDGYAWTTRICIDLHVLIKLSIYLSIRSDEGKDNDWICQAPHNRGVSPQYIDIFHLNLTA